MRLFCPDFQIIFRERKTASYSFSPFIRRRRFDLVDGRRIKEGKQSEREILMNKRRKTFPEAETIKREMKNTLKENLLDSCEFILGVGVVKGLLLTFFQVEHC